MDNEYFECECEYHKKLCKMCEMIEEADKMEFVKIKVKRWKTRRKQRDNQNKQTNGEIQNK